MGNGGGNFDSGQKNPFLSLEGDIFGPLDESSEVAAGLNVVADAEVAGPLFEKRVSGLFDFLASLFSFSSFGLNNNILTIIGL